MQLIDCLKIVHMPRQLRCRDILCLNVRQTWNELVAGSWTTTTGKFHCIWTAVEIINRQERIQAPTKKKLVTSHERHFVSNHRQPIVLSTAYSGYQEKNKSRHYWPFVRGSHQLQRVSNSESVFMPWHHHGIVMFPQDWFKVCAQSMRDGVT